MKIDRSTLSYRALYLRHTIIYAVFAVLWLLLALADSGAVGDLSGGALVVVWVLFLLLNFAVMTAYLVFAARRDKADELYRENVAKTNAAFIRVLLVIGCVLFFAFGSLQVGLVGAVRLPVHQGYIAAVLYLGAAVWHGIAMHYEQTPEEETDA